jgi:hypothetical protein
VAKRELFLALIKIAENGKGRINTTQFYNIARKSGFIRSQQIKELLMYLIANEVLVESNIATQLYEIQNIEFLRNEVM